MHERFFGLSERPFDLVSNPKHLFLTSRQRETLSNLWLGMTTPRGVTPMIGEAGMGKTTLLQALLSDIDQKTVECVLISHPTLSVRESCEFLVDGFSLPSVAATSKTQFLFELRRHLVARREAGLLSALVVDEAQGLPHELLEEVRLLTNCDAPTTKLLNVVLAGQPPLARRLNEPGFLQLKQRVSLRCELRAFDFHETAAERWARRAGSRREPGRRSPGGGSHPRSCPS